MTTECPPNLTSVRLDRLGALINRLHDTIAGLTQDALAMLVENGRLSARVAELEAENARLRGEG